ncbi:MAG TPA: hypothetical protein VFM18_24270 [Methanosarcina sp.]|nr:hypothetical protein [Methanosarcina sp.]
MTTNKTLNQRWEDGDEHDPRSIELYKFIADLDFKECGDSFCFKSGGDGDNGETLMYLLDCWFALNSIQEVNLTLSDIKEMALQEQLLLFCDNLDSLRDIVRATENALLIKKKKLLQSIS